MDDRYLILFVLIYYIIAFCWLLDFLPILSKKYNLIYDFKFKFN